VQIRRNEARDELMVNHPCSAARRTRPDSRPTNIITAIISEVDPKTGDPYDKRKSRRTKGLTTEDASSSSRGVADTRIKIRVEREGSSKPLEFTLIRKEIEVESVLGHKRNDKTDTWNLRHRPGEQDLLRPPDPVLR